VSDGGELFEARLPVILSWQSVPIEECGERLVKLEPAPRLFIDPMYWKLNYPSALPAIYLRAGLAERLKSVVAVLPADVGLTVWDGWRPLELQHALYEEYRASLMGCRNLGKRDVDELASIFVSPPSDGPAAPSPHFTGGAVDLTLAAPNGAPLDMGSRFDEFSQRAYTDYYAGRPNGAEIATRRALLVEAMGTGGFSNDPAEWWHFDCGNQLWAVSRNTNAVYGGIVLNG
jgi:zinc D-Ala-D-Ala dipeptidase